jgi:hypothetical protein
VSASVTASPQQSSFLENPKMFRNRGQGHGVGAGEVGNASIAPSKMREDPTAGGIGQRGERPVQRARIFNHLVNY